MKRLVVIISSTGGPKALQQVLPKLPQRMACSILVVQHMLAGYTSSLAHRLNELSEIEVTEANEQERLREDVVYLAKGGNQLRIVPVGSKEHKITLSDEKGTYGLRPCADITFETLAESKFDYILCVVMTGMGSDGLVGIKKLKQKKKVYVISQNKETSTVYGMPRVIEEGGLSDEVVPLENIADAIIKNMGVR